MARETIQLTYWSWHPFVYRHQCAHWSQCPRQPQCWQQPHSAPSAWQLYLHATGIVAPDWVEDERDSGKIPEIDVHGHPPQWHGQLYHGYKDGLDGLRIMPPPEGIEQHEVHGGHVAWRGIELELHTSVLDLGDDYRDVLGGISICPMLNSDKCEKTL